MKLTDKAATICLALVANLIYTLGIIKILEWILKTNWTGGHPPNNLAATLFFSCIIAPLWEELAFRHVPLQISRILNKHYNTEQFTLLVVLLSSIIFGWGHGFGPISLLIQGVSGLCMCYVYIKNGYSYWSSVTYHALWNLGCLLVSLH